MIAGDRRTSVVVTAVGAIAFLGLAALLVPWSPVPGGMPPSVPADEVFSAEDIARAEEYSGWARLVSYGSLAVSLAVACWFGLTSAGARLVTRLPGSWWLKVILAVVALAAIGRAVILPFGLLLHRHRTEYGLTRQPVGEYLVDAAKSAGVGAVVLSVVAIVLVGSARRWPRRWPAVAGASLATLVMLGSFGYPVLVEPLFNRFTPLADSELRAEVLALAERQGVEVDDVLVADASRRTTTLNAYVSGLGATRRVVLYDNLVADVPQDQVLSVVAHELAHARHRDVLTGSSLGAAGAAFGVGLLGVLVGRRPQVRTMRDPAVVPLVLALVAIGSVLSSPIESTISRRIETRADVTALVATRDPHAFVRLQEQLALRSLADPTPPRWSQLWFGSHPTALERIGLAERTPMVGAENAERARALARTAPGRRLWLRLSPDQPTSEDRGDRGCQPAEPVVHGHAERPDPEHDRQGDEAHEQAVLGGGGAAFVLWSRKLANRLGRRGSHRSLLP